MAPTTSAERTAKFRRRGKEKGFETGDREKTRLRVAAIRQKQKSTITVRCPLNRKCKDPECKLHIERDRKRLYRQKLQGKGKA